MADHERIWLEPAPGADEEYGRQWCQHNVWGDDATEYVAATELEALRRRVEELEAENAGLKLAMTPIALAAQTAGTAWLDTETIDRLPHVGCTLQLGYLRNIVAALMDAKEREE